MSLLQLSGKNGPTAIKAGEVMTQDVYVVPPDQTIAKAALLMRARDVGSVAVAFDDKLIGMLTDRDIAVRAVAGNLGLATRVRDVMSGRVMYCFDDEDINAVARNMAALRIRRLPVVNRDKRLVGFISLSNIAASGDAGHGAIVLGGVATPH